MLRRKTLLISLLTVFVVAGVATGMAGCQAKKKPRAEPVTEGLDGGTLLFSDTFDRQELGPDWLTRSGRWEIKDGWLHVREGDKNEGAWLNRPLPERVRVEFDARSLSDDGDIKFEIFNTEQRHQTGYIAILGGWKNSVSIIARLDEHGEDRLEADARVVKGKVHRFTAVRTDRTLRWFVDGNLVLQYVDSNPIRGPHFGFNNWVTDVYFDNLKVFEL